MILIITGIRITSLENFAWQPPSGTEGDIFVNTFIDYLLSLLRLVLPDPMAMNESSKQLITLKNASIYGLRHIERSRPAVLNAYSTPDNDYINCLLTLDLKDHFKVDGFFQISTFLFDSEFSPAILQLFDFIIGLNLTLTLPKAYDNTSEALVRLDGIPTVKISRLKFTSPSEAEEESIFGFLTYITSLLSSGPLGGYIEGTIGRGIRKATERLNEKMQKTVEKYVDKYT